MVIGMTRGVEREQKMMMNYLQTRMRPYIIKTAKSKKGIKFLGVEGL